LTSHRYDFASDNTAPAMPEVTDAFARFNTGFCAGYGDDEVCEKAADLLRELLDVDAAVRFTTSGTAANALSLAALVQPHEAVIAHEHAHIVTDEAGAPGFFGAGMGFITLPGPSGKIDPSDLAGTPKKPDKAHLNSPDQAHMQPAAALSITNSTEYGTVYSEAEVAAIAALVKAAGRTLHLDGARLANAAAAGFDVKCLARLGFDVVILGGTKAGSTPTEAIMLLNRDLERRLGARMKHAGQLVSKARFLAAPWIGMLETGAWTARAAHANAMAKRLADAMPFHVTHPVQANGVFISMDEVVHERLRQAGWHTYRVIDGSVRFMCSWATMPETVDELVATLKAIA
jgi:threonine aldolase